MALLAFFCVAAAHQLGKNRVNRLANLAARQLRWR